ncbi:MAG: HpcH/HpaI aldolase/citrate lyase family protein [Novosphingobium sp.]
MSLPVPQNPFKQKLLAREPQVGLWSALGSSVCAELCAAGDFDWMLIDAEHGVNDVASVLPQLQAIAAYRTQAIVRLPEGEVALIKRYLDIGAQNLMIPMVESADDARRIAAAVAYAPVGVRGLATMTRAARWSRMPDYVAQARDHICLIAQIESVAGINNLEEIAAVDGIDSLFFGPADLAASMGLPGQAGHPDVVAEIWRSLERISTAGKPAGIFVVDEVLAKECLSRGYAYAAVGADAILLSRAVDDLRQRFR